MDPINPIDVLIRQQVYLEGVKNGADNSDELTAIIFAVLLATMAHHGITSFSGLTKKALMAFLADFNASLAAKLGNFQVKLITTLKEIMRVDELVTRLNFKDLTGKLTLKPNAKLQWTQASNQIMAVGHTPLNLIRDFGRSTANQAGVIIKQAYAEGWTAAQLLAAVKGTREAKFKDGMLARVARQYNTVQQTLIQHFHSFLAFNVGKMFYDRYQWVSVLDSATTPICLSRSGQVFEYATGPRPPAHYNCRSTIVALPKEVPNYPAPSSYYTWLLGQPASFQNDAIGQRRAVLLRSGKLLQRDLPKFDGTKPLTAAEFLAKRNEMMKPTTKG